VECCHCLPPFLSLPAFTPGIELLAAAIPRSNAGIGTLRQYCVSPLHRRSYKSPICSPSIDTSRIVVTTLNCFARLFLSRASTVTRYVTFKVGTFKGADARIAAYYSFPDNEKQKNAAFVWSHGGGQRADRGRGVYFAKQGFATVDINWLGRPMEPAIDVNTDWGKVDPTQGPRFYSKALRKGWKRNLQPDDYSIDPVPSPRNTNWFLLTVAARRAITFLEQQPEVDPNRIGLAGFSMGGMITALTAIDSRLKAVAPFVGGSGFKYIDFPGGIQGNSIRPHFQELELYTKTVDASAYWPLVKCPVMFISSSNDFHSTFERIYQSRCPSTNIFLSTCSQCAAIACRNPCRWNEEKLRPSC